MNNNKRIFGAVFLTAIYFFALGAVSNSIKYSEILKISAPVEVLVFSNFSETLFYQSQKTENSVSYYNSIPTQWFKNDFKSLWATIKAVNKQFETSIANYLTQYENFILSFEDIDIIFPAHYFW